MSHPLFTKEFIEHEYILLNKTARQISQETGHCSKTLRKWMKFHNIENRETAKRKDKPNPETILTLEFLTDNYVNKGKSAFQISKQTGITLRVVSRYVTNFDLKRSFITRRGIDITDQKFGNLTARYRTERKARSGALYWECECVCGKIVEKTSSYLLYNMGKNTSMYCRECDTKINKIKGFEDISGRYWASIKSGALQRNIEFNISINYAWEIFVLQNNRCAISGEKIFFSKTTVTDRSQTASLDRIDSKKGYVEGNIQWTHKTVNRIKMALLDQEFISWCHTISDYQRSK